MLSPFIQRAQGGQQALDRDHCLYALGLLMEPSQTFELRGVTSPSANSRICKGSDLPAAVETAYELSEHKGVYYCLNPLPHGLDRAPRKADVLSRRWMLIDIDAQEAHVKETNATEEEKAKASKIVDALLDYLVGALGWPHPIVIDSGNGFHLLVRVDLPNDKLAQQLIKQVLITLADKFDTAEVHIDRAMHDAVRIAKLPGSWARKGPHSEERPHRLARVVYAPEQSIVSTEQLRELAGRGKGQAAVVTGNGSPFSVRATNGHGLDGYVRSAIERECGRLCMTPPSGGPKGGRDNQLNASAWSLGTMADWPEMNKAEALQALCAAGRQCGLDDGSIERAFNSGWNAGLLEPRQRPLEPSTNGVHPARATIDLMSRLIILASEVTTRPVQWLWTNRIPLGKLTTFAGWGGLGKSFVTMDLAARISTGGDIPGGTPGECFEAGNVLILNTEDDPEDTSVPRLIEAGADLKRIGFARSEILGQFNLGDLKTLDAMLEQLGGARMLVIDPATAHLGDKDDHKNAELRALLMPLSLWSMERSLAVILVTHVNKPSAGKVEAMARVVGSVAWVNAVRAAVMFSKDPNDPTRRLFIPFKANNAPEQKGLSYRVVSTDILAKVEWLGEVDTTADEAMNDTKAATAGGDAAEWVTDMFREQLEWDSKELKRLGGAAGHSDHAIFKSKEVKALPIKKSPKTNANGNTTWTWSAKSGWPPLKESSESSES